MELDIPFETKSICVFATHRQKTNNFSHDTLVYVNVLSRYFDFIVVVADIENGEVDDLNINFFPNNSSLYLIPNYGFDFGKFWSVLYKLKIHSVYRNTIEKIALINDSCFIINDLKDVFVWGQGKPFWGMTYSQEVSPHLQSFFLIFETKNSIEKLYEFIEKNNALNCFSKDEIILKYEVGLSQFMHQNGFDLHGMFNFTQLQKVVIPNHNRRYSKTGANIAFIMWDRMIHIGCPIIKVKRRHFYHEMEFINRYSDKKLWDKFVNKNDTQKINVHKWKTDE